MLVESFELSDEGPGVLEQLDYLHYEILFFTIRYTKIVGNFLESTFLPSLSTVQKCAKIEKVIF